MRIFVFFFFQAEDGIRDLIVTGVQTCALPICATPLKPQRPAAPGDRLTAAQQAVLELMAKGLQDDKIAQLTRTSTTTVRRHIAAILRRLSVSSRFAAGAAAQRRGWI